ncbi:MAG: hypothetical protein ACOYNI_02060 [Acidimicrobiia bacterium]
MLEFDDHREPEKKGGITVTPRLVGALVLFVLIITFIVQNTDKIRVEFIFFNATVGVWFLITLSVIAGMMLGALLYARRERARRQRD